LNVCHEAFGALIGIIDWLWKIKGGELFPAGSDMACSGVFDLLLVASLSGFSLFVYKMCVTHRSIENNIFT
jgi:hypothetical protein